MRIDQSVQQALLDVVNTDHCTRCGVELIPGKTWRKWHILRKDRICTDCIKVRVIEWRRKYKETIKEKEHRKYVENKDKILAKQAEFRRKNAERYAYRRNRNGAKTRGIPFELTFDEFHTFWQKPCEYCGTEITTAGLDRVDNDGPYSKENIVPCCVVCNRMKANRPLSVFIDHCLKVSERANKWRLLLSQLKQP